MGTLKIAVAEQILFESGLPNLVVGLEHVLGLLWKSTFSVFINPGTGSVPNPGHFTYRIVHRLRMHTNLVSLESLMFVVSEKYRVCIN